MKRLKTRWMKLGLGLMLALQVGGALALSIGVAGVAHGAPGTGGIYVDDSPAATETFERARGLIGQKRYVEAVGLLLKLSKEHEGRLIGTGPGRYADIRVQVQETLRGEPQLLSAYRSEAEPMAAKALAEARGGAAGDAEKLRVLIERYWLTKSALTASMDLTAGMIAEAKFEQARWMIAQAETHPDAKEHRTRILKLRVALARLTGDKAGLAKALEEGAGQEDVVKTGGGWTNIPAPEATAGGMANGGGAQSPLPTLADLKKIDLKAPLWEFSLRQTYLDEGQLAALAMQGFPVKEFKLPFIVKPTVHDGMVILNTGLKVIALDQLSGRQVWSHTAVQPNINDGTQMQIVQAGAGHRMPEARGVTVSGNRLIAVVGYSPFLLDPWVIGRLPSALVCLDVTTGKQLWKYDVPRADPKLGRTMLSGTPVVVGNVAYVSFCKPNGGRSEMGAGQSELYVGAFNVETGAPLWNRYVLSSGRMQVSRRPETPEISLDGADLLVADPSGSLVRLDARTGGIRWLTTPSTAAGGGGGVSMGGMYINVGGVEQPVPEFEAMHLPVGLVVKFPGTDQLGVYDAQTGKTVEPGNVIKTGDLDTMAQVGENFLLASRSLQLIDGATFKRIWTVALKEANDGRAYGMPWPARVIEDAVLVPLGDKLLCFNLETGKDLGTLPMAGQGTLDFSGQEAMLTDRESVRYFMSWDGALAQIRERANKRPEDPRTGMSLAYLGLKKQDTAITMEGLGMVSRTGQALKDARPADADVNVADPKSQAMVDFLISFAGAQNNSSLALRKAVLETLAKVVQTPRQEVEYRLSLIDYLRQTKQAAEAVAQVQTVLGDVGLASQPVTRGPITQRAEFWARSVLATLIEENGIGIYAAFDAQAKSLLDAQTLSGAPDAAACQRIAERFPFAQTTARAFYLAAAGKISNDPLGASRLLGRAYQLAKKREDLELILGRLVEVNIRLNQQTRALGWLRRAQREYPGMTVWRYETKVAPEAWINQLQAKSTGALGAGAMAEMRQPVQLVQGMSLPMPIESLERETISSRYVVGLERSNVFVMDPVTLVRSESKSIQGMAGPVSLVFQDGDRLCLWMPAVRRLAFYNVGETLQLTPGPGLNINQVLESAGNDQTRLEQMNAEQRGVEQMINPRMPMVVFNGRMVNREEATRSMAQAEFIGVTDSVVVIADSNGRVCAIDRSTGEVAWKLLLPMDQVDSLWVSPDAVVIKGVMGRFKTEDQTGVIAVLDPLTGEQRVANIEAPEAFGWAGVTGEGYLAYLSRGDVVTRQVKPGAAVKRTAVSPLASRAFFSASSGSILLQENLSTLALFDPASGEVLGRASIRPDDPKEPLRAQAMGQGWVAWVKGSMVAMDKSGKVLWKTPEDYVVRPLMGARVPGGSEAGHVLAIRAVEQAEAGQGAAAAVFSMLPGPGPSAVGTNMYVRSVYTEGKVGADGKQELEFTTRVTLAGGRAVKLSGKAEGHVSSSPEDKVKKVEAAAKTLMNQDPELVIWMKPKAGKVPVPVFVTESAGRERQAAFGGLMYELLSYEAGTGRLVGRQLMGPFRDPVEPETWYLSNNRLFLDKLRPVLEDGSGRRFNRAGWNDNDDF
jgi:outer membrane protein assembly factor BamB